MKLCKVVGNATSSVKHAGLGSYKLLVLRALDETGNLTGEAFLAVDQLGAGMSEVVAVAMGAPAMNAVKNHDLPVDAAVVAILDEVSINKKEIYSKNKES
jgi:ethanolamine utilization protein EutN